MPTPSFIILARADLPLYEQMQACALAGQALPPEGAAPSILSCPSAVVFERARDGLAAVGIPFEPAADSRAALIGPCAGPAAHGAERILFSLGCAPFSAESAGPGIRVVPTADALCSTVILSPAKVSELALLFSLRQLAERVQDAAFSLPLDHPEMDSPALRLLAQESGRLDAIELPENSAAYWLAHAEDHRFSTWLAELSEPHAGDCCGIACSCMRCIMESYIGLNTSPGSKAEGHRLWGMRQQRLALARAASDSHALNPVDGASKTPSM